MGKKETAETINKDEKKLRKDKKKRKKQKTDQDHASSERLEENEDIVSDNDGIDKECKVKADLTEGVSDDGVKHIRKERKMAKEDCMLQGEMSEEDSKGCDEIMAETEESVMASVQSSELDQDEALKKGKKKKKKKKKRKERVDDGGQSSSLLNSKIKPKAKEEVELKKESSSFMDLKKESDSDGEEVDNSNVSEVKKKGESKNGGRKRKQKNELIDSNDTETGATNDDSPGEEKDEYEELVKKKKKKSKEKDKAKNRLVEDKEKPEQSEKKDGAVENQWQSAQFGDTAQKEKFLRLMGANKPSNKQRPASSYSVMAMDGKQEKVLSNSLEKQFLQALQTRKERGLGLGYQ